MNCRDAEARLDQFVDRELTADEIEEVQHHLDSCPPCLQKFRYESQVRRLVRLACSELAPSSLRMRIIVECQRDIQELK